MDAAKIDLKVLARSANGSVESGVDAAALVGIFHRWIQQGEIEELMIDVADYSHVPDGPDVLLVCHGGHYGVDRSGGELGLLYSRRRQTATDAGPSSFDDRLKSVFLSALTAGAKLESEAALSGALSFPCSRFVVCLNDRRFDADSAGSLVSAVDGFLKPLYPDAEVDVHPAAGQGRLTVRVEISEAPGCESLLRRIQGV